MVVIQYGTLKKLNNFPPFFLPLQLTLDFLSLYLFPTSLPLFTFASSLTDPTTSKAPDGLIVNIENASLQRCHHGKVL